jgi:hypothetical protein
MHQTDKFSLVTKRLVIGDWLKSEWRARGLLKGVQLTISGCLGPCDLPNVVTISDESGTQWLGDITEFAQYQAIVDWASRYKTRFRSLVPAIA